MILTGPLSRVAMTRLHVRLWVLRLACWLVGQHEPYEYTDEGSAMRICGLCGKELDPTNPPFGTYPDGD